MVYIVHTHTHTSTHTQTHTHIQTNTHAHTHTHTHTHKHTHIHTHTHTQHTQELGGNGEMSYASSTNTWHNTRRMIFVKSNPKTNRPSGYWPIPESFWPDSSYSMLVRTYVYLQYGAWATSKKLRCWQNPYCTAGSAQHMLCILV